MQEDSEHGQPGTDDSRARSLKTAANGRGATLWQADATDLLAAFAAAATSPTEVLEECMSRVARLNPVLNAIVALSPSAAAEAEASTARWRSGAPRGKLDGLPVVVKDNLVVAGMAASFGSPLFAGYTPAEDELPIRKLRDAGAILFAKTNCPEFALEGFTANALHGVTRNPYDPALTPGGSSGGSVAAVAAGLAPLAIGTDGGGSLRRPAAYTGLFGLKPSVGEVARGPGLPQLLFDFEVVGPFARSVRDLRLVHQVLAGSDPGDPASRRRVPPRPMPRRCRILYAERIAQNACDSEILARCRAAAARFAEFGHEVVSAALPFSTEELNQSWPIIGQSALAALRREMPDFDRKASPKYRAMADAGEAIPAHRLYRLLDDIQRLRREASLAFQSWDAIMTPAVAAMPWSAADAFPTVIEGREAGPRGHAVYTGWVNAAHHPAIACPTDHGPGLPIGFQLVGDLQAEPLLMDLAEQYELAFLGQRFWPPMAG
jgi:aspartyl-tRNA(Asn)/glutamyl-tRNA(Gln) amidotransferase subunit A